jgi:proline iminopeptidase
MSKTEGFVTTEDGISLYVESHGDGPQAVLFPNGMLLRDHFTRRLSGRKLVFHDPRNRGRSDALDLASPKLGIRQDAADLETVRRHLGAADVQVIAHSYAGLMAVLHALEHPGSISAIVLIGPMQPFAGKQYPPHLAGADDVPRQVFAELATLEAARTTTEPEAFCRKFWSIFRRFYVTDAAHAERLDWGRCELANERAAMRYWMATMMPSIQALDLTPEALATVGTRVLVIHATRDRGAPYGGGREWALALPNARLLTVDGVGHAPWIEAPDVVFPAVESFLAGEWPAQAESVTSID